MRLYKGFLIIIIFNISFLTLAQTQSIYITNQADSVSIYNSGKLVAKLFWPDNPVIGQNDVIDVSVKNNYLLPPSAGGLNYSLNKPLHFSLRTLSAINFDWGVYLRLYIDTSIFNVEDIISNTNIYKVFDNDTLFTKLNFSEPVHGSDYVEFEIQNISEGVNYIVIGFNLLFGIFNASQLKEPFSEDVLVPGNKELTFNEGVSLNTNNYSKLVVRGILNCNGTKINPINFNQVQVEIWGQNDQLFDNNALQLNCSYTNMIYINQYYSNSILNNCIFRNINVSYYSSSTVLNSGLLAAHFNWSKGLLDNCHFDSSGFSGAANSIVEIKNCFIEHNSSEADFINSLVVLKNNVIYSDVFGAAVKFTNSLGIAVGNKLISLDDECYNDGFSVYGGSFAILSKNIIQGKFRAAMRCGYGDTLVAYNNTILEGCGGFNLSSNGSNRMVFVNNIFYMLGWNINLDYNSFSQGQNITYVDSNLSYSGDPLSTNYIYNPQDSSIICGNTNPIIADPEFIDLENCYLKSSSPAIDKGMKKIYSFGCLFNVLDTAVIIPDSIAVSTYYGSEPDLGANEYNPSVNVNDYIDGTLPNTFSLSQNYPNPFNPATKITYSISKTSFVVLKVYDILGKEILTLVKEEKPAGKYEVKLNGSSLSSGVYFYRIQAGNFTDTKKLLLLK